MKVDELIQRLSQMPGYYDVVTGRDQDVLDVVTQTQPEGRSLDGRIRDARPVVAIL